MADNNKHKIYIKWFWIIFSAPFILSILLFALISLGAFPPMPTFEQLENPENDLAAEIYSEDSVLLGKFYVQNRTWVELEQVSPHMINALLATEDIRYYKHSGIDAKGLMRVFVRTILMGDRSSGGGSTLTQQLAKNLYGRDTTTYHSAFTRNLNLILTKFKEWVTAAKLERRYTKEEILTMYLNVFDFLYQAVGIESAAKIYFDTTPGSLTIEQSAVLVGMAKNPWYYNPIRFPERTLQRRNVVFGQMLRYDMISKEEFDSLKLLPLELEFKVQTHNQGMATYFREYLRNIMTQNEPGKNSTEARKQWDTNPLYGWCNKNKKPDGTHYNLYTDGLKIYTTINSKMQKYAEEAMAEHLGSELQSIFEQHIKYFNTPPFSNDLTRSQVNNIMYRTMKRTARYKLLEKQDVPEDSIRLIFNTPAEMSVFSWKGEIDTVMSPMDSILYYKKILRSGLFSYDPETGYVKAYVGGLDFKHFKWDAVTLQKRQVGSTIKPFLYTLAMQNGYSPCYKVDNVPITFEDNDTIWTPRSSNKPEYWDKKVTLKWGLAKSENYISAWLVKQFNAQSVVNLVKKMGVQSPMDPVPSIIYGTSDISLYEMVAAYGAFVNKGVRTEPVMVTHIEDKNGNLISSFETIEDEVLSEETAYLMTDMLSAVVNSGTAIALRTRFEIPNQMGGKTGTTQNQSDGWFMGILPKLVTGVWVGGEDRSIHFESLGLGSGSNMALPIFGYYLQKINQDSSLYISPKDTFVKPFNFNIKTDCNEIEPEEVKNINTNIYDEF